jgi:gas vesicle protein
MRKILNFFIGMMMGGLVGATVALLLAPTSGEEMRAQIQEQSIRLRDEVKAVAEARRAELERELSALRAPYRKG